MSDASRPPPRRARPPGEWRLFCIALQFLTRVPVPAATGFEPAWLNASARHFPLVGTLVGGVGGAAFWVGSQLWPPAVAAGASIVATLLLTGAFHEDGLADTCDALGGAVGRERALEIMKDSRIGSYGAVALVAALGLKAAALASMAPALAVPLTVFAHTVSRAVPVLLIRRLDYAGDPAHAKARPMARRVARRDLAIALASTAVVGLLLAAAAPAAAAGLAGGIVVLAPVPLAASRWLARRLGGYTGDTLGAAQQVAELAVLLGGLAAARWTAG